MTKILHILDHSLPMHSGYTFRTRAIMKAQQNRGWDVAGITGIRHTDRLTGNPDRPEIVDGLDFYRTYARISGPSPLREWREIAALTNAVDALCADYRPDILHAHSPALNGMAALRVAQRRQIPFVYEIRAFWEDAAVANGTGSEGSPRYWLTRQLENHVIAGADAVVTICEGLKQDLRSRGVPADKITVSPNGVDMDMFGAPLPYDGALAAELGLRNKKVIGFIGSFYDYEGLDDLIAAMPALQLTHPDAALLLVGGGPMEAALKVQASASSASRAICFAGRVPHTGVERYYSLIDILAYPRKSMRLTNLVTPLKPLEAMAQKRLVAASDVGGHRELIEHGVTGSLFAPDNPSALARTLGELLSSAQIWDLRRENGYRFVRNDRNWGVNIQRYQPVYQKLLSHSAMDRIHAVA